MCRHYTIFVNSNLCIHLLSPPSSFRFGAMCLAFWPEEKFLIKERGAVSWAVVWEGEHGQISFHLREKYNLYSNRLIPIVGNHISQWSIYVMYILWHNALYTALITADNGTLAVNVTLNPINQTDNGIHCHDLDWRYTLSRRQGHVTGQGYRHARDSPRRPSPGLMTLQSNLYFHIEL